MLNANVPSSFGQQSIQNQVDIDEMLVNVASIDAQIAHYEALKKHRNKVLDAEIDRLEQHKQAYRDAIRDFMASSGDKTLKYPGVGTVTRKAGTRKWNVKDEEKLIEFLKHAPGLSPQLLAKVIITEETLVKKELNKVLDSLQANNTLSTDSVEAEVSQESLSISFDKGDSLLTAVKGKQDSLFSSPPQQSPLTPLTASDWDAMEI